jgi:PAS domain S-box-containing protein
MAIDTKSTPLITPKELRIEAVHRLQAKKAQSSTIQSEAAPKQLDQELEVYQIELEVQNNELRRVQLELETQQIELEMQNEELCRVMGELEVSRYKYSELYDFAPVGYFTFDVSGVIREVNLTGAHLLGRERQLLATTPFISFIADAAGREVFSHHLERVLQKQGMQRCEIRITRKDGSVINGELQSVLIDSLETTDGSIFTSIVDGTVSKQLETEIQDAREYSENIVETVHKPLVVLNSDLKILTANRSFYDTFKVTPEETIGNFIYDLGNRQWDIPKLRVLFEDILPHETVLNNYEVDHNFIEIGRKVILLNAREIFRKNIGSHIILLAMEDITERKLLETELQHAHDKLEGIVQERTADLTKSNIQLTLEIEERKKAEGSLHGAYSEIKQLKDRLQAENIYLQQEVARQFNFGEIIGQSHVLASVFSQVQQVAPMNATVLLLGETGTGKGVVARAIHSSSTRKGRPLITVDCTTLPATLVESELFGRERGAFTGSDAMQIGRFELADGGTIFLDEIGEMPLELQSKLLRVIQDGEFERLGSPRTKKTDVRIIAATNRNLGEEVRNGKFREDLFYRLNVFPITMPPLRQRKEDIPLLVNHFVAKFNTKIGKKIETVSKDTLNALQEYHWPGNVRELESVIERAVIISQGSALQVLDRFDTLRKPDNAADQDVKALAELEHDHILQVLQKTGWRIEGKTGAALILGLNASTLRARMRKFGIARQ